MSAVTAASTESFQLAEGPVWDAGRQRLLWAAAQEHVVLVHPDGARQDGHMASVGVRGIPVPPWTPTDSFPPDSTGGPSDE
jgi:sugar lactone lactonase YvrE